MRQLLAPEDRLTALIDHGAPPLLGYALACSLAWHTRRPCRLISAMPAGPQLTTLADRLLSLRPGRSRAYLRLADGVAGSGDTLPALMVPGSEPEHVLLQVPPGSDVPPAARVITLAGPSGSVGPSGDYTIRSPVPSTLTRPNRQRELHVPELQREDESALLRGLLSPATPAGRALGWAARDLAGLKVGVALGAGAALGYAHIGVLSALLAAGVPIDYIAGSSVGACIGALYSAGYGPDVMTQLLDEVGASAWRLTLPRAGLLSLKPLRQHFRTLGGDRRIEDLPIPLAIVAADIAGLREVVFRRGPVWPALLASIAIPGVFPPQRIDPYILVDGGVVDPVPAGVAAAIGADLVLAVELLQRPRAGRVEVESSEPHGLPPSLVHTITRAIELMQSRISSIGDGNALTISVPFGPDDDPGLRRFSQGRRFIPAGEAAVTKAMPLLSARLPWLGSESRVENGGDAGRFRRPG